MEYRANTLWYIATVIVCISFKLCVFINLSILYGKGQAKDQALDGIIFNCMVWNVCSRHVVRTIQ